jgi:curved DNA-binding protein CbpA
MTTDVYEKIGRRLVDIFSSTTATYAAPAKKKNCKKENISCGFTCISGKLVCRKEMTMEQQRAAKELRRQVRAGKKTAAAPPAGSGGGLVVVEKPKAAASDKPKTFRDMQQAIDEKYASDNPSAEAADNWLKETIALNNSDSPENITDKAANELQRNKFDSIGWETGDKFAKRVRDKTSYIEARSALSDFEKETDPVRVKRRMDPESWVQSRMSRGDGLKISDLPNLRAKYEKTKSEKVKKTLAGQIASLEGDKAREPEIRVMAEADARKWNIAYNGTPAERADQFGAEWDSQEAKTRTEYTKKAADIAAGKKSAVADAAFDVGLRNGYEFEENDAKPGSYFPPNTEGWKDVLKQKAAMTADKLFPEDATRAEVRAKYKELASKLHPDVGGNVDEFRKMKDAYDRALERV